jgi:hypothetical protein
VCPRERERGVRTCPEKKKIERIASALGPRLCMVERERDGERGRGIDIHSIPVADMSFVCG